jgi:hypothetical protein
MRVRLLVWYCCRWSRQVSGQKRFFLCFCFLVASRESRDLRIRDGEATPHTINRTCYNFHIDFSVLSSQSCTCCLYRHFMKNYQELEGEKIGGGGTTSGSGKLQLKTHYYLLSRARVLGLGKQPLGVRVQVGNTSFSLSRGGSAAT